MKNMYYSTKVLRSPCYECTDRSVGCHSSCERYVSYRSTLDGAHDDLRKKKKPIINYRDYAYKRFMKLKAIRNERKGR